MSYNPLNTNTSKFTFPQEYTAKPVPEYHPQEKLYLETDHYATNLKGNNYGCLDLNTSVNQALGMNSSCDLFNALECAEDKLKHENPSTTVYKGTDDSKGTFSAYAAQDFFIKAAGAYGIKFNEHTANIGFNTVVNVADKNGDCQLDQHEFKFATHLLEQEIKHKTQKDVNIFDFKDDYSGGYPMQPTPRPIPKPYTHEPINPFDLAKDSYLGKNNIETDYSRDFSTY